jgi:hypothetical protein
MPMEPLSAPPLRDTAPELVEFTTICPATVKVPLLTVIAFPLAPVVMIDANGEPEVPPALRYIRRDPVSAKAYWVALAFVDDSVTLIVTFDGWLATAQPDGFEHTGFATFDASDESVATAGLVPSTERKNCLAPESQQYEAIRPSA